MAVSTDAPSRNPTLFPINPPLDVQGHECGKVLRHQDWCL